MNRKAAIALVLDGKLPDGTPATDDERAAGFVYCRDEDPELAQLLALAKFGAHLDGQDAGWDERQRALDRLERIAAGPVEQPIDPRRVDEIEVELAEAAVSKTRENRRRLADAHLDRPALRRDGRPRPDPRQLLEAAAERLGWAPGYLLRPLARGRPSAEEAARRDELARAVYEAHRRGARLASIASVLGCSTPRASELRQRGAELESAT